MFAFAPDGMSLDAAEIEDVRQVIGIGVATSRHVRRVRYLTKRPEL